MATILTFFYAILGFVSECLYIYQFDLNGNLKNVYFLNRKNWKPQTLYAKKSGGFYTFSEEAIEFLQGC